MLGVLVIKLETGENTSDSAIGDPNTTNGLHWYIYIYI